MQTRPATLTLYLLALLLVIAWIITLMLPAQGLAVELRWVLALIFLPTLAGYGLYCLRDLHAIRIELGTLNRYASWLVLGAAGLIVLNELGLLGGGGVDVQALGDGVGKLLLSLLFWTVSLTLFFRRTRALRQDSGDGVLAVLYVVVIGVHNFPEGLALGMSVSQASSASAETGLVAALALQNIVDAVIAGAVLLPRRIGSGWKVGYLLALPVLEGLSAALVLNGAWLTVPPGNGVLMFAASGMLAIAVSDMVMSRRPAPTAAAEQSGTK